MRYLFTFLIVTNVWASAYEECVFEAELKFEEKEKQQVILKKLINEQGHFHDCKRFLGSQRVVIKNYGEFPGATQFKLKYSSYSGMGPNGPVSSSSWQIVKEAK